ncbi:hypothetical protein IWQ61_001296 [Dispira simplex]|nr:hypothetical protein IWQ61_001296 [Dispira simplex]
MPIKPAPHVWFSQTNVPLANLYPDGELLRYVYQVQFATDGDEPMGEFGTMTVDTSETSSKVTVQPMDSTRWKLFCARGVSEDNGLLGWYGESLHSGVASMGNLVPNAVVTWRVTGQKRGLELCLLRWSESNGAVPTSGSEGIHRSPLAKLLLCFPSDIISCPVLVVDQQRQHLVVWVALVSGYVIRFQFRTPQLFDAKGMLSVRTAVHPVSSLVSGKRVGVFTHAMDADSFLIGCHDGVTVLLEREPPSYDYSSPTNTWQEHELAAAGILSQVRTFIPYVSSRLFTTGSGQGTSSVSSLPTTEWQPIALTSFNTSAVFAQQPSELAQHYLLSLSRDRKLRVWSIARKHCVKTLPLPHINPYGKVDVTQLSAGSANDRSAAALHFPTVPRPYIRVLPPTSTSTNENHHHYDDGTFHVVIYLPDERQPYFSLYRGVLDSQTGHLVDFSLQAYRLCPEFTGSDRASGSSLDELLDFGVSSSSTVLPTSATCAPGLFMLWALWSTMGERTHRHASLSYTYFVIPSSEHADDVHPVYGNRWHQVLHAPHPDVVDSTGYFEPRLAYLDTQLPIPDMGEPRIYTKALADLFLDYLFYPGRFSKLVLQHALTQYQRAVRHRRPGAVGKDKESRPVVIGADKALRHRISITVGAFLYPTLQGQEAMVLDSDSYRHQLRTEWMRYLSLCTQIQHITEVTHSLTVIHRSDSSVEIPTVVVARGLSLGVVRMADTCDVLFHHQIAPQQLTIALGSSLLPTTRLRTYYPHLAESEQLQNILRTLRAAHQVSELVSPTQIFVLTQCLVEWVRNSSNVCLPQPVLLKWYKEHIYPSLVDNAAVGVVLGDLVRDALTHLKQSWPALVRVLTQTAKSLEKELPVHTGNTKGESNQGSWRPGVLLEALGGVVFQLSALARYYLVRDLFVLSVVLLGTQHKIESDTRTSLSEQFIHQLVRLTYRLYLAHWVGSQSLDAATCTTLDVPLTQSTEVKEEQMTTERQAWIAKYSGLEAPPLRLPTVVPGRNTIPSPSGDSLALVDRVTTNMSSLHVQDPTDLVTGDRTLGSTPSSISIARGLTYSLPHALLAAFTRPDFGVTTGMSDRQLPVLRINGTAYGPFTALSTVTTGLVHWLWYTLGLSCQGLSTNPVSGDDNPTEADPSTSETLMFPAKLHPLVYKLLAGGHIHLAHQLLAFCPPSLTARFLWGQLYLRLGLYANAYRCLELVGSGAFAPASETHTDEHIFRTLLPTHVENPLEYYQMCADLMEAYQQPHFVTKFCQLAVTVLDNATDGEMWTNDGQDHSSVKQRLYFRIFHSMLQDKRYDEAYMAMLQIRGNNVLQRDCLRHLISVLCEQRQMHLITRWSFGELQEEVEQTLLFKARNSEIHPGLMVARSTAVLADSEGQNNVQESPRIPPNYYKILYAYHTYRGDYRSASSAMFQYAERLGDLVHREVQAYVTCLVEQTTAYLSAIQALSLVDPEYAWVTVTPTGHISHGDGSHQMKKRRLLSPASSTVANQPEQDSHTLAPPGASKKVVQLVTMRREYQLCLAKLRLAELFPELQLDTQALEFRDALTLFVRSGMYDHALSLAVLFETDLTYIFRHLAKECVQVSTWATTHPQEETTDGLWSSDPNIISELPEVFRANDSLLTLEGSPETRIWKLLQNYLDQYDPALPQTMDSTTLQSTDTDTSLSPPSNTYRTAAIDEILLMRGCVPPWLSQPLFQHHPDTLVRLLLTHGYLEEAAQTTIQFIQSAIHRYRMTPIDHSMMRWMPFNLLDQLRNSIQLALDPKDITGANNCADRASRPKLLEINAELETHLKLYIERINRETEECLAQV